MSNLCRLLAALWLAVLPLNGLVFSEMLVNSALDLTNAAYCTPERIGNWSCPSCQRAEDIGTRPTQTPKVFSGLVGGFKSLQDFGTQAFVAPMDMVLVDGSNTSERVVVVSFRGSATLVNWLLDAELTLTTPAEFCDDCEVHLGFYLSWLSVARLVMKEVQRLVDLEPEAKIVITGHSLGAAMAVLAAAYMSFHALLPVYAVYTFGQPRVGNKAFHDYYSGIDDGFASFRAVHWRDPVPHLPLPWMPNGTYTHVGTEVWYNENSTTRQACLANSEDPTCSLSKPLSPFSGNDHITYLGYTYDMTKCDH